MRLTETGVLYTQARDRVSRARIINIIYWVYTVHPRRAGLILFPIGRVETQNALILRDRETAMDLLTDEGRKSLPEESVLDY